MPFPCEKEGWWLLKLFLEHLETVCQLLERYRLVELGRHEVVARLLSNVDGGGG